MPLQLIEDGYTLDDTIKTPRWPAVEIKYRPALAVAVRDFYRELRNARNGEAELKAMAALLKAHVLGWDIEDNKTPCGISEATIRRVPDPILQSIIETVTSYGPKEQEADEKNSSSG